MTAKKLYTASARIPFVHERPGDHLGRLLDTVENPRMAFTLMASQLRDTAGRMAEIAGKLDGVDPKSIALFASGKTVTIAGPPDLIASLVEEELASDADEVDDELEDLDELEDIDVPDGEDA